MNGVMKAMDERELTDVAVEIVMRETIAGAAKYSQIDMQISRIYIKLLFLLLLQLLLPMILYK